MILNCLTLSCTDKKKTLNEREARIVSIIMDMHVAEAAMGKVPDKYKDSLRLTYRAEIARIHDLEPFELDSILLNIQEDPVLFQRLTKEAMMRMDSIERTLH